MSTTVYDCGFITYDPVDRHNTWLYTPDHLFTDTVPMSTNHARIKRPVEATQAVDEEDPIVEAPSPTTKASRLGDDDNEGRLSWWLHGEDLDGPKDIDGKVSMIYCYIDLNI
jgi:hypothetical protein